MLQAVFNVHSLLALFMVLYFKVGEILIHHFIKLDLKMYAVSRSYATKYYIAKEIRKITLLTTNVRLNDLEQLHPRIAFAISVFILQGHMK